MLLYRAGCWHANTVDNNEDVGVRESITKLIRHSTTNFPTLRESADDRDT